MSLLREYIAPDPKAPVMVLFGGHPERMNEVISLLKDSISSLTTIGNFSEQEGLTRLSTLKKVDLVLIGGRYSEEERLRIRSFMNTHFPEVPITEPGYHYKYDNNEILNDVRKKLGLKK